MEAMTAQATKAKTGEPTRAVNWQPNLGPRGYVWDQLPVRLRAQWREHVGLDRDGILGFEYAIGLKGIGAILTLDKGKPIGPDPIRRHIERRGLPVMRPLAGCGFPECGKLISPLCQLLKWAEIHMDRSWGCVLTPLPREEVR
jgi:hypothetical protein